MARKQEAILYDEAYRCLLDLEIELGEQTLLMDGLKDWVDGEDDLLDHFSTLNMDKMTCREEARRVEELEEACIQQVIREEQAKNFAISAAWSIRIGTMGGHRMVQKYEECLYQAGE